MTDSNSSSTNNLKVSNTFFITTLVLSILGFFDTAYLTIIHYKNLIPPCSIAHGCETVLTSRFSMIWGIPIQIPGILFYLATIVILLVISQTRQRLFLIVLTILVSLGLIVSAVLFYLQAFVLHAFCQYCLASEVIICTEALITWREIKRNKISPQP